MHWENSLIMYGVYNAETLEELVKTAHALHSQQSLVEDLFVGQKVAAYEIYSKMQMLVAFNIMWWRCYYIYVLSKKNILQFIMNL